MMIEKMTTLWQTIGSCPMSALSPATPATTGRVTPQRIAVLGAESTGKTTLAQALGSQLDAIVVGEYLREFCDREQRVPRPEEQARIAAEQARREGLALVAAAERGMNWVVCDTSPLMIALYSIDCFGDTSLVEQAVAHQRGYATTLLCMPDIRWVADGIQRMSPATRERIHHALVELLDAHGLPWLGVTGEGDQRVESAMTALVPSTRVARRA